MIEAVSYKAYRNDAGQIVVQSTIATSLEALAALHRDGWCNSEASAIDALGPAPEPLGNPASDPEVDPKADIADAEPKRQTHSKPHGSAHGGSKKK